MSGTQKSTQSEERRASQVPLKINRPQIGLFFCVKNEDILFLEIVRFIFLDIVRKKVLTLVRSNVLEIAMWNVLSLERESYG